ncbi:MAG: CoA transferase [Dehalococcoidia bacterium]|jgi:crotonobetainyl-CoA:carnitine CoA-transferase CaiB-like acyl-CoA transferase|nr:CoA transferase [Dehalococcoidia bacterium]
MPAPLEGIKVLDFTRFQNGPHATVMLSDMGAEVLKVERPGDGDPGRALGRQPDGFCGYFEALDRGKRSITLDLSVEAGKEVVRKLVEEADVLTENFRPKVMDRLGLGYEDLRKVNPQLIYAINSGFGPKGSWADNGSFDVVAQGMSGAMISQGGGPDAEPVHIGWGLADQVGSMVFAFGVMTAIVARERHGVGQKVDVSQLGAMMTLQTLSVTSFLHNKEQRGRPGRNPTFTYYQASDGKWLTIGVLTPKFWDGLCAALERPDLLTDERSAEPFARFANAPWLLEELASTIRTKPQEHWLEELKVADVPCGPIHDYASVVADEQFWANDYLVDLEHPLFGNDHRVVGNPVSFSETPGLVQGPAPELGQHTEETLLALGYDWDQITALRDQGTI